MENLLGKHKRVVLGTLGVIVAIALLYYVRESLISTLQPFFYGVVFAFLVNPTATKLDNLGCKRWTTALVTALAMLLILVVFFLVFVPSIVRDALQLVQQLPRGINFLAAKYKDELDSITGWLQSIGQPPSAQIGDFSKRIADLLSAALTTAVSSIGSLLDILLTPIITFYLVKDKEIILRDLGDLLPPARLNTLRELWIDVRRVLNGYVKGRLLVSLLVALMTGFGCLALGLSNTLTIGIAAGLFDLVPYFGPWLGGLLPVLIALMGPDPLVKAISVVLLIMAVQAIEINLISPRIISETVGLHPLLVMFSVIFFGSVMGIPGMIIGVPITASAIALFKHIRRKSESNKTSDSQQTSAPPPTTDMPEEKVNPLPQNPPGADTIRKNA
ncbi:MAG: AI-2E family transporter [Christensenellales bacterium]